MAIRRTSAATTINRGVSAAAATPVNIITGSGGAGGSGATVNISSIQIANSGFTALDDTAVSTAGGFIIINGTGFQSGASVRIQGTSATSVAFVSSSRLNVTVPAISSGTLDIYVINPDGSGAILISGFVSSGVPSWSTTSPLTQQEDGAAFSIQLAATGDGTVTYGVSSGSTLPSGTTLASNGRFSGTITGLLQDTTYTFSVDAIDSQNQETARTFNITITVGDQYYNLTTLHLSGDYAGNTWISDASTNGFAVTVNGDTRPMAFSPYETVWSNFFDGTGDWLTTASNAALNLGTGDFTLEAWIYVTTFGSNSPILDKRVTAGGIAPWVWYTDTAGKLNFYTGTNYITTTTFPLNTWTHVVTSRVNGTLYQFINGVSAMTPTSVTTDLDTSATLLIGSSNDSPQVFFKGYISNLRIVKGSGVSTVTVPTSPLTAIANTSLLTCQSNRLRDASTNNFTITRNGDVSVTNFGPFTETDLVTGSGYFDGTGDYISSPYSSSTANWYSSDTTIEMWVYPFSITVSGTNAAPLQISHGQFNSDVLYWSFGYNAAGRVGLYYFNGSAQNVTATSGTVLVNQWNHLAMTHNNSSGEIRLYLNGALVGTGTKSGTPQSSASFPINIGVAQGTYYTGYISNVRIVNGTRVYTSDFTPPTSPLTPVTNTSLLTLQSRTGENNNRFVDNSGINSIVTRNGNTSQGTFSPFSQTGWSNFFDGTMSTCLKFGSNSNLALGSGNFTVEFWLYLNAGASGGFTTYLDYRTNGFSPANIPLIADFNNNGKMAFVVGTGGGFSQILESSGTVPLNSWTHVALIRNGSTVTLYFNGTSVGSGSSSVNFGIETLNLNNPQSTGNYNVNGYFSNMRIVKGTAIYTSAFTPPTSPLTAIANTALLTCQNNRFVDNSTNNFTLTTSGTPSVQSFSPFKITSAWSANTVGGSSYFDGTGDYLTVPDNTLLDTFTDFTIEFWVYFNSVSGTQVVLDKGWNGATVAPYVIFHSGGNMVAYASSNGSSWDVLGGSSFGTLTAGQWYHIALTRSGSSIRLFRNGALITTVTNGTALVNGASALGIGGGPSAGANPLNGYISNLRINRSSALYTSAFTPPTAPLPPTAGSVLLLSGANGGIIDSTSRNNLETIGNVQLSTSVKKFGSTSLYFDGTGDYLYVPSSVNYGYGTGNFTIEFWLYLNSTGLQTIVSHLSSNPQVKPHIYYSGGVRLYVNGADVITGGTVTISTWTHIALSRSATSTKLFINGTQSGSTYTDSNNYGTSSPLIIGDYGVPATGSNMLNGYIDDLRITKGVARYTSNFTVPAQAFNLK